MIEARPEGPPSPREGLPAAPAVQAFIASMPRAYRQLFDDEAVAAHAGVVMRRGTSAVHVEIWREFPERITGLCVVADDEAGLLARISAALLAENFDVVSAQAFCRTRADGRSEAVDLFRIRRLARTASAPESVRARDVAILGATLDTLVRTRTRIEQNLRFARPEGVPVAAERTPPSEPIAVQFEKDERDGGMVLTIQGPDRAGLLYLITDTLAREGVRIARSEVTTQDGIALDRFQLTEPDGGPLRRARLLGIQTAVLAALE
jgi:UTP:GlnB (protein PII) uridylyltransferase